MNQCILVKRRRFLVKRKIDIKTEQAQMTQETKLEGE